MSALTFLCSSEQEVRAVESQLKIIIRPLYSNPPINGARIATEIMTQPEIHTEWWASAWLVVVYSTCVRDSQPIRTIAGSMSSCSVMTGWISFLPSQAGRAKANGQQDHGNETEAARWPHPWRYMYAWTTCCINVPSFLPPSLPLPSLQVPLATGRTSQNRSVCSATLGWIPNRWSCSRKTMASTWRKMVVSLLSLLPPRMWTMLPKQFTRSPSDTYNSLWPAHLTVDRVVLLIQLNVSRFV